MTKRVLSRMFRVLTGERITKARYAQLLAEFSAGDDEPVEPDVVRLMAEYGVIYVSDGLVIEEEVLV